MVRPWENGSARQPAERRSPSPSSPSSRRRVTMRRIILTSLAVATLVGLSLAQLAPAQQATPPPPWKQGQPANMADSTLAPIAQPPAPKAPGEIPVDKIKVPR